MLKFIGRKGAAFLFIGCEDPNLGGSGTVITRAAPVESVAPVNDQFAVRRIIRVIQCGVVLAKDFASEGFYIQGIKRIVRGVTFGTEKDLLAVGAPAKRDLTAGMLGQLAGGAALCRNGVNIPIPIAFAA